MNYIPQIAKMLGVDIWEEFDLNLGDGTSLCTYRFTEERFESRTNLPGWINGDKYTLSLILEGKARIVKTQWRPKLGESYWWVDSAGAVHFRKAVMEETNIVHMRYRLGNCYKTKGEAEADREKWARFYSDDSLIDWEEKHDG